MDIVITSSNSYVHFVGLTIKNLKNITDSGNYNVFVVGVTKYYEIEGATVIPANLPEDAPWSDRFIQGIQQVPAAEFLLITEDILFLPCKGKQSPVLNLYQRFKAEQWNYLKLSSLPLPEPCKGKDAGVAQMSVYTLYRLSLQPSIWNKDYLLKVLNSGESIWEFELNGSFRSRADKDVYGIRNWKTVPYLEAISRGKLTKEAARYLGKQGCLTALPIQNMRETIKRHFYHFMVRTLGKWMFFKKHLGV